MPSETRTPTDDDILRDALDGKAAVVKCVVCAKLTTIPPGKGESVFPVCECGEPCIFVRWVE